MAILQLQNVLRCKFQNSIALLLYVLAMVTRRRRRRRRRREEEEHTRDKAGRR
jgi:hypothetical protein